MVWISFSSTSSRVRGVELRGALSTTPGGVWIWWTMPCMVPSLISERVWVCWVCHAEMGFPCLPLFSQFIGLVLSFLQPVRYGPILCCLTPWVPGLQQFDMKLHNAFMGGLYFTGYLPLLLHHDIRPLPMNQQFILWWRQKQQDFLSRLKYSGLHFAWYCCFCPTWACSSTDLANSTIC